MFTTATIAPAIASAVVGSHDVWIVPATFGVWGGAFDSIIRECPDADELYVYADGVVHVWDHA